MNVFKRKSIYLAVVAGLGAVGMAGTSSAVNINSNGTGEVLIYPYYSVRDGQNTYISVVNTTASSKAVKVRFTEGKNSREVLDFNLYMSPYDVWTGFLEATSDGARLKTSDKSCTYPAIPAAGQPFVNYGYAGSLKEGINDSGGDGETQSLDRTREGYFEIIEMGVITNTTITAAIKHNSAGVPAACSTVQTSAVTMNAGGTHPAVAPTGGLAGTASLINPASGIDYGYDPVALAAFSDANIWYAAGTISPDMRNASPAVSRIFKGGTVVSTDWTGSAGTAAVNAVTAVIMHNHIMNEFMLDTGTLSGTDWVITMPTKRYYVPVNNNVVDSTDALPAAALAPFTKTFYKDGACETVLPSYYSREEQFTSTPATFSPPPPAGDPTSLCWESTVLTFNGANVLGSTNSVSYPVIYENGWMSLSFNQTLSSAANAAGANHSVAGVHTYVGLPTVGFMVQDFINQNAEPGMKATYGGNFSHKYTNNITVPGGVPAAADE